MEKSVVCKVRTLALVLLLMGLAVDPVQAQVLSGNTVPKGFWVVESNIKAHKGSLIRFYTEDARLVYEEYLEKTCLDIKHPKTVVLLNAALDEVMINWSLTHSEQKGGNIVADLKKRGVDDQLYVVSKN